MIITQPTVLVLSAGASAPLNFPIGKKLTGEIIESILSSDSSDDMSFVSRLRACVHPLQPLHTLESVLEFANSLRDSALNSVDAFLEIQPQFIPIGKAAIAMKLLPHEDPGSVLSEENGNWYLYFRNRIHARSVEEFRKHKLSIITYNYDRSFEYFMLRAIKGTYRPAEKNCVTLLHTIPILHLHGQLGQLTGDNARSYEAITEPDRRVTQACADSIRIIHEDISEDPVFEEALRLLSEASTICFLGFGYDEINLDRLRISALGASKPKVYGTAFKVPKGERDAITEFPNIRSWHHVGHCGAGLFNVSGEASYSLLERM